jgi:formylglycine-generating enzyme required for sulfatase activity
MLGRRTLVKMDLVNYEPLANLIESITGSTGVSGLNAKIRQWVEESLREIGVGKGEILERWMVGDSALASFNLANDAHCFAKLVHRNLDKWKIKNRIEYNILFRIGCATGELDVRTHDGTLNTIAYRLEPKADPGGILIDIQTYEELSPGFQNEYDVEKVVYGKQNRAYNSRSWIDPSRPRKANEFSNRISDIPKLSGSIPYSFETVLLNEKGEITYRDMFGTASYLVELLEDQELYMLIIPGGEYGMGSSERKARTCEKPQHQVIIGNFLMSQHPITKAQWEIVASWPQINRRLNKRPSRDGSRDSPVVKVSWYDAIEFCDRLSLKTGNAYRLPTEAEWEYACRAGTETLFHFGQTITSSYVNYDATIAYRSEVQGPYRRKRTPVNEFQYPNRFGLFDMHGNVWEWCMDHWHNTYMSAPSNGQAWIDPKSSIRLIRGGSWSSEPQLCTSYYRYSHNESDNLANDVGFRVVRLLR